jgi:hypothetical protein
MLERVQKKFTKRLIGYKELTYSERLVKSNLKSLELGRILVDMQLCYKILHDLVEIDITNLFTYDLNNLTRGHGLKLRASKPICNVSLFSYSYSSFSLE